MKYLVRTAATAGLAALVAACTQPYGERYDPYDPYGYPPQQGQYPGGQYDPYGGQQQQVLDPYRATGTEPFWSLTITPQEMRFDSANGLRVAEATPRAINGYAGPVYRGRRLEVNIVRGQGCSDGMSDRRYPDQVQVYVDGREYRGCGAPERDYQQGSYDNPYGTPSYGSGYDQPAVPLDRTSWRVTRVNGLSVPSGGYYMNFQPNNRLSAKFGCNEMTGGYRLYGDRLDLGGGLSMTRMACPDMSFETRATNILSSPLRVEMDRDGVTFSNDRGRIDAVRAN
ncbi:META domain-containing protein [Sphingomicrobium arenosum]|uniref:META domain-containing protein n=1 Tax=Sphingomicrobium arenosum TaxID=2233861 RepID=UPI002240D39E|nr:META domain-containing protein [Sphingomicrobium arenosum]